jgi:integrase
VTILAYVGKRRGPDGKPLRSYGYRFVHSGTIHKRMVGPERALAVEAEKRERARLARAQFEGRWGALSPALLRWSVAVERYVVAKNKKRSLDQDERRLRWWGEFLALHGVHYLQDVTPDVVDLAKLALDADHKKPATVQRYLAVLRTLCRLAVRRWGVLSRDPVAAVDWPHARRVPIRVPNAHERDALLEAARAESPTLFALVTAALHTALREGDLLRLTAADFARAAGWVDGYGAKGGRSLSLPVTPTLRAAVDALGILAGPLFRWPDGRPMTRFPRKRWNAVRAAAKLPWLRFHDLRHAVGTILADEGVPARVIQEFLGHASSRTTELYTHPLRESLERAAKRLDRRLEPTRARPRK